MGTPDPAGYGLVSALGGNPGLWSWLTGDREYRPGYGEWLLEAPGTTRIASADLELAYADKLFAHHCLELGLRDGARHGRDVVRHCSPPPPPAAQEHWNVPLADPSPEPASKQAYVRVEMPICNNPAPTPCSKWIPALDPLKNGHIARVKHVDMVLVDDDLPTPVSSGQFRTFEERYINGRESYDVALSANDPGAGVARLAFEHLGTGDALAHDVRCDPAHHTPELGSRICPPQASRNDRYDTRVLPEGAQRFRALASDLANNRGLEAPWRLFVDRTPPPAPHDFEVDLDDEADVAEVTWIADDDPDLADGNPGSGVASWEHRLYHPRLGWSDWHRGTESIQVPDSFQGDDIRIEARSLDAVDNGSPIAEVTLTIPDEDDEEGFEENLDDDEPEEVIAEAASASSSSQMTLTFAPASAQERREAALAEVRAACEARPLNKVRCYRAVKTACRIGGICLQAKKIACAGARLFCPRADVSRVSTVRLYQPITRVDTHDRFWPVSFSAALRMRWDGRSTCMVQFGDCVARGEAAIKNRLGPFTAQFDEDDLYMDLPPNRGDLEDHFKATQDALGFGSDRIDPDRDNTDPQWDKVYKSSRMYWYRGGGYGRGSASISSLQYWSYWTYNYLESDAGLVGKHESDLEMLAVLFGHNDPIFVHMSRHGNSLGGEARSYTWNDPRLERAAGPYPPSQYGGERTHPVAYAAHGSHAMYNHPGEDHAVSHPYKWYPRSGGLPDDRFPRDRSRWLSFGPRSERSERAGLINLAGTSWACWGGRLGKGGSKPDFSSAPSAPLWQQSPFGGDRNPCLRSTASTASISSVRAAREPHDGHGPSTAVRSAGAGAAAQSTASTGDPLVDAAARCGSWYQPPEQPGIVVIACDQTQLDHFVASGLTDPGPGGATLNGPGGADNSSVPTVYADDDPSRLARLTITGRGTATAIYVAQQRWGGRLLQATLSGVPLPQGEPLHVRVVNGAMELVGTDGRVLTRSALQIARSPAATRVPRAKGVRVRSRGRGRVTVTWKAQRGLLYDIAAAPTRSSNGRRLLRQLRSTRDGRVQVSLGVRRSDRWIAVTAGTEYAAAPAVLVRLRGHPRRRGGPRQHTRRRSPTP